MSSLGSWTACIVSAVRDCKGTRKLATARIETEILFIIHSKRMRRRARLVGDLCHPFSRRRSMCCILLTLIDSTSTQQNTSASQTRNRRIGAVPVHRLDTVDATSKRTSAASCHRAVSGGVRRKADVDSHSRSEDVSMHCGSCQLQNEMQCRWRPPPMHDPPYDTASRLIDTAARRHRGPVDPLVHELVDGARCYRSARRCYIETVLCNQGSPVRTLGRSPMRDSIQLIRTPRKR